MQSRNFFSKHFGSVFLTALRSGHAMKFFKYLAITGSKVLHICEIFAAFTLNLYPISWWSNASFIFINTINTWSGRDNFLWKMIACSSVLFMTQKNTFAYYVEIHILIHILYSFERKHIFGILNFVTQMTL